MKSHFWSIPHICRQGLLQFGLSERLSDVGWTQRILTHRWARMENTTGSADKPLRFVDTLDLLFVECWSGDPDTVIACRLNTALGFISAIIPPVILLGGFIGNGLTAYIYLWKLRPITRQGVYFAVIAISDNCCLFITGFMWLFLAKGLPWISGARIGYFILNVSDMVCRVYRHLDYFANLAARSLFLVMVIDRCLSVYFPFRLQRVSAKTAMKACLIVTAADVLLTIAYCIQFHWQLMGDGNTYCSFLLDGWEFWASTAFSFMFFKPATPIYIAILVANVFLIKKMRQIALEQAEIRAGSHGDSKLTNTVICVILSVLLLAFSIPRFISYIGETTIIVLVTMRSHVDLKMLKVLFACNDLSTILYLFNQSINWIVLIWKSAQFRKAFVSSLCICRGDQADADHQIRQLAVINAGPVNPNVAIQRS